MHDVARSTPRGRTAAALVAVVAAVALLPAPAAAQEPARDLAHACPEGVPASGFGDLEDNIHAPAVDCLALYGLTTGITPGVYAPGGTVRRDQMASFVMRLLDIAGLDVPAAADVAFDDVPPGNVHAEAINRLAAQGIVGGFADGSYQPATVVRRDQMTAFLNRAFAAVAGEPLVAPRRYFTDVDGNAHEGDIHALAGAGVAVGTAAGTFRPAQPVRRDQMASFVMRLVDVLAEEQLLFTSVHVVTLDGYLVVDDIDPQAVRMGQGDPRVLGHAFLGLHSGTGRLCYEIAILSEGTLVSSHLTRTAMDATGPTEVRLEAPGESGVIDGCVLVDQALLRDIEADPAGFAVDVRSVEYPGGVARGQLGTSHRAVALSGAFVTDPGDQPRFGRGQTDAGGVAVLQIDVANGRLCGYVRTDAAPPYLGADIGVGAMDTTGPTVLELAVPEDATGEASGCVDHDPAQLAELVQHSNAFHLTVRTQDFPDGAVRSQLDTGTLGIPMSGAFVIDPEGQPAHGEPDATGAAWLQADFESGVTCFWLTTDATGPFLAAHIVRAAAGETGTTLVAVPTPDDKTGEVSGCQHIDPDLLAETGHVERFSIVVATEAYPDGAVRGQFADGLQFSAVSRGG